MTSGSKLSASFKIFGKKVILCKTKPSFAVHSSIAQRGAKVFGSSLKIDYQNTPFKKAFEKEKYFTFNTLNS